MEAVNKEKMAAASTGFSYQSLSLMEIKILEKYWGKVNKKVAFIF